MAEKLTAITSPEDLELWLEGRPRAWAQALAARSALRVLPLVLRVFQHKADAVDLDLEKALTLSVFRANFISWAASKYPAHDMSAAAADATTAARATAAAYATDAAYAAADAAYAATAAARATTAAARATAAAARATTAAAVPIWEAMDADCRWLEANAGNGDDAAARLVDQPLWPPAAAARAAAIMPLWVDESLERFSRSALVQSGPWGVWLRWYGSILPERLGTRPRSAFGAETDIVIATGGDDFWAGDADEVTARIADMAGHAWSPDVDPDGVDGPDDDEPGEAEENRQQQDDTAEALRHLPQDPHGAQVVAHGARLAFERSPVGEAEANDPVARQLHEEVRRKARLLAAAAPRLENQNKALADAALLFADLVDRDLEVLAGEITTAWSLSVSLGGFRDADKAAAARRDGYVEPLAGDIRGLLDDLVMVSGPFVRRFAIARELDDELARFEDRPQMFDAAKALFDTVLTSELLDPQAEQALAISQKSGEAEGTQPGKARGWFSKSVKNVAVVALAGTLYLFKPSADRIGQRIADTKLVEMIGNWAGSSIDKILPLFQDEPPDQRGAMEEALKRIGRNENAEPPEP